MSSVFDQCFALTVGVEGPFDRSSGDSGNWTGGAVGVGKLVGTKFGISAASYPILDIQNLTLTDAQTIYLRDFYNPISGDQLHPMLAGLLFDAAVNHGRGWSIPAFQRAVGVADDGVIGPETLSAASTNIPTLHAEFARLRDEQYRSDKQWPTDGKGWIRRLMYVVAASSQFASN